MVLLLPTSENAVIYSYMQAANAAVYTGLLDQHMAAVFMQHIQKQVHNFSRMFMYVFEPTSFDYVFQLMCITEQASIIVQQLQSITG